MRCAVDVDGRNGARLPSARQSPANAGRSTASNCAGDSVTQPACVNRPGVIPNWRANARVRWL